MAVETIDFDLSTCVEDVLELLAPQAHNKGLEIAALIYNNVPIHLQGDGSRLRQILMNLTGNAIKFTSVGEVVVRAQLCSQTPTTATILFSVTAKPDVAVVDIGLPDIDGIELTRRFREFQTESGDAATKILVLTMDHTEDTVLAAFAAGADSYYMKDSSIDRLTEAIQATYDGQCWIDPAIANVVLQQMRISLAKNLESDQPKTVKIKALACEYEQVLQAHRLTPREQEILELIVAGCSNGEIALRLYLTVGTVKTHVRNILNKLCVDDRTQAAVRALRCGLVV